MSPFLRHRYEARQLTHARQHRWRHWWRKFGWRWDGIYIARSLWGSKVQEAP